MARSFGKLTVWIGDAAAGNTKAAKQGRRGAKPGVIVTGPVSAEREQTKITIEVPDGRRRETFSVNIQDVQSIRDLLDRFNRDWQASRRARQVREWSEAGVKAQHGPADERAKRQSELMDAVKAYRTRHPQATQNAIARAAREARRQERGQCAREEDRPPHPS